MSSLAVCEVRLATGADADAFERSVLEVLFPAVGERPRDQDTFVLRTLYGRDRSDQGEYLLTVLSAFVGDREFDGMRDVLTDAGADVSDVRRFELRGSVPDADRASAFEQQHHELLDCRLTLAGDRDDQEFERQLLEDILPPVAARGPTRTQFFKAFRLFRGRSSAAGTDYLVAGLGFFFNDMLFGAGEIRNAGGEIDAIRAFRRLGGVAGEVIPSESPV
jgi:hypothetical protein